MAKLLEYIDTKYGSVNDYLDSIGFPHESQRAMFEFLTEEKLSDLSEHVEEEATSANCQPRNNNNNHYHDYSASGPSM